MPLELPSWYDLWRKKQNQSPSKYLAKSGGGGGGSPKTRIGRTGPRGRRFPVLKTPQQRSIVIKSRYIKNDATAANRLRRWIYYCVKEKVTEKEREQQHDGRELELNRDLSTAELREKHFFNAHREEMSYFEALKLIRDNVGQNVAFHTIILSSGYRQIDPQAFARDQMAALEAELGHQLIWVANCHRDTGPDKMHVHVTVAGRIPGTEQLREERKERTEPLQIPAGYKIDYDKIDAQDKITGADGLNYSKYDSVERLKDFSEFCNSDDENHIPRHEYQALWRWIGTKEQNGENCYGKPPLQKQEWEIDLDKVENEDRLDFGKRTYTKFHSLKELSALDNILKESGKGDLEPADKAKLEEWIQAKERDGEGVFGEAPLKEVERDPEAEARTRLSRQIDISKIPIEERIQPLGKTYTKYHPLGELQQLKEWLDVNPNRQLPEAQQNLLNNWIETKEERGDDAFGAPPLVQNYLHSYHKIDYAAMPQSDKLTLHGTTYTKYDRLERLEKLYETMDSFSGSDAGNKREWMIEKLDRWIMNKLAYGDGFEGNPPTQQIPTDGMARIDLDKLPESQKIDLEGTVYTKFHPREDLQQGLEKCSNLIERSEENLEAFGEKYGNFKQFDRAKQDSVKAQYEALKAEGHALEESQTKLKFWDYLKEQHGDDVFGRPPLEHFEINYRKIPKDERIPLQGNICTKYDSLERLQEYLEMAQTDTKISDVQRNRLAEWVETKLELGDDAYGQPPLKEVTGRFQRDYSLVQDPTDRAAIELLDDKIISPMGAKLQADLARMDRMKEWGEKQEIMRRTANERGDVFITRKAFDGMRDRGNAYVNYQLNLDKTLEYEFERVFGERILDAERDFHQEPELSRKQGLEPQAEIDIDKVFQQEYERLFGSIDENILPTKGLEFETGEIEKGEIDRGEGETQITDSVNQTMDSADAAVHHQDELDKEEEELHTDPYT